MMRVIVVLSCLLGMSVAQSYDCSACVTCTGTRENELGCLGFCDADGDQDGLITEDELTAVFNGWGPTDGCCVETCFLAAHEAFPACDDEKQLIFSYFASLTAIGDDVVICDPPFVDAWWTDLGGTPGGTIGPAEYQTWWNYVYGRFHDPTCPTPCGTSA